MDQLTAYKILGLVAGATPEEIKEAYAVLSKEYHPEEHPEEFQRIHEAYTTLTRRRRVRTAEPAYSEWDERENEPRQPVTERQDFNFKEAEVEEPVREKQPVVETPTFNFEEVEIEEEQPEYDFERIHSEHTKQETPTYSFEEAMEKAKLEEAVRLHELALEAAAELKVLVSPKYKSNTKAYKTFFEDKKYEAIIRRADFLEKLCDVLENSKLSKQVYNYIIEFYRLRGRNPGELSQVGLRLYNILDAKVGMKQSNPAVYGGVAAVFVSCIHLLKPLVRQSEILSGIVIAVALVFLFVWIFKKVKEKHSILLEQIVVSLGIALSQFIVIMFDLYGTLFGSIDDGNTVAALIFLAAIAWFIVVLCIIIIKAVIGLLSYK